MLSRYLRSIALWSDTSFPCEPPKAFGPALDEDDEGVGDEALRLSRPEDDVNGWAGGGCEGRAKWALGSILTDCWGTLGGLEGN